MSSALPAPTPPATLPAATLHLLGALALELKGDAPVLLRTALVQTEVGDMVCDSDENRERLHRLQQHFEARQRQFAAVLGAHGVAVNFVHCDHGADYRIALR